MCTNFFHLESFKLLSVSIKHVKLVLLQVCSIREYLVKIVLE